MYATRDKTSHLSETDTKLASPPHRFRNRRIIACVAIIGIVATTVVYFWPQSSSRRERQPPPEPPPVDVSNLPSTAKTQIRKLRQAVLEEQDSATRWGRLAMMLRAYNFESESSFCFREAERLDPTDYRWPYLLGVTLAIRDAPAAMRAFRRSVKVSGRIPEPRLRLAELAFDQEDLEESKRQFQAVRDLNTQDPRTHARALLGLSRIAFLTNDVSESRRLAEESAAMAPGQRTTHELLAQIYHRLSRPMQARQQLAILRLLPDRPTNWPDPLVSFLIELRRDADWLAAQAQQRMRQGDTIGAIALLRRVVLRRNTVSGYHAELVRALMLAGRLTEAERELKLAKDRHPKASELWRLHGELEFGRKNFAAAAVQFRNAVSRKPDHAQAWARLGNCYVHLTKTESAIDAFQNAVRIDPSLWKTQADLGIQLAKIGNVTEAIPRMRAAAALRPGDVSIKKRLYELTEMKSKM